MDVFRRSKGKKSSLRNGQKSRIDRSARKAVDQELDPSLSSFFAKVEEFLAKGNTNGNGEDVKTDDVALQPDSLFARARPSLNPTRPFDPSNLEGDTIKSSLFEVFDVPKPPEPCSEIAFDHESFEEFCDLLPAVLRLHAVVHRSRILSADQKQSVLNWIELDEPAIPHDLPLIQDAWKEGNGESKVIRNALDSDVDDVKKVVRKELRKQRHILKRHLQWKNSQYKYAMEILVQAARKCSVAPSALPLAVIWEKFKEAGYLRKKAIDHCIKAATSIAANSMRRRRLASGMYGTKLRELLSIGSELEDDDTDIAEQIAIVHDILFQPEEHTVSIRIRRLVDLGHAEGATYLIEHYLDGNAKLRAYPLVFKLLLNQKKVNSAFGIFGKMSESSKIVPVESDSYVQLIAGIAENGLFNPNAHPIESAIEWGYNPAFGPQLLDQLVDEMAKNTVEITSASANRLKRAFTNGFVGQKSSDHHDAIADFAPMSTCNLTASDDELIVDRVTIDAKSGVCPRSGARLQLIELRQEERLAFKNRIIEIASKTRRVGNIQRDDRDHANAVLQNFWNWLENRKGEPYTAILDGANVGFYMQNFDEGKFNFNQILFVVNALKQMGEHPLVILPKRYTTPSFTVSLGLGTRKQTLDAEDKRVIEQLVQDDLLYTVPHGLLDDFFSLLASVSNQTSSRKGKDLYVGTQSADGRWPGTRPVLITNDQLGDHKELNLMETSLFNRWYSNCIVNYNFAGFINDNCIDPEIGFSPADFFSREIQGNVVCVTNGGMSWHFPVQDWESSDWFCIRIPQATNES